MARSRTLTNLLLDVRQRTNQENSTFVTDAELTEYLNQELAELWTRLVLAQGQPHYRSSTTHSVVPPTALYALPADFWTLQEVTSTANGSTVTLLPFMTSEHGALINSTLLVSQSPVRYRLQAGNIEFRPATEAFTATLYYTSTSPRLSAGGDTFDGFNGFEMCAIAGVCATVFAKEDSDPRFYSEQKDRFYQVAERAAAHRDMANPERTQDVTSHVDWWLL
jgi:hypothetical protein